MTSYDLHERELVETELVETELAEIKKFTCGDTIRQGVYTNLRENLPPFKVHLLSNDLPNRIDSALWRKVKIIPFDSIWNDIRS